MMNARANGFNPLRWDCKKSGCYNKVLRPRIEHFAPCFPRKIAMSDVDGIVEIGGNFMMLEWKQPPGVLGRGQEIMFQKLTRKGMPFKIFVVTGDSQSMEISDYAVFENGTYRRFDGVNFQDLISNIIDWAEWADANRR